MDFTPEEYDYYRERMCIMVAEGVPEAVAYAYVIMRIKLERQRQEDRNL